MIARAKPHFVPPASAQATPLSQDFFCIHCQYNLRTRTPADRCPECGAPVSDSISHHRDHAEAIVHPRLLQAAAVLFGAAMLLCVVTFVLVYGLRFFGPTALNPRGMIREDLLISMAQLIFVGGIVSGIFCAGAALGNMVIRPTVRPVAALLVGGYALLNVVTIFLTFTLLGRARARAAVFVMILQSVRVGHFACAVMYWVLVIMGYWVMRNLAKSLASPQLKRTTQLAFGLQFMDACLGVAIYAWMMMWPPGTRQYDGFIFSADLFSTIVAVIFGLYWVQVARGLRLRPLEEPAPAPADALDARPAPLPPAAKVTQFLAHKSPSI